MNIKDFSYSRLCNNLQGANGPSDIRGRRYLICEYQLCTLYRRKSRLSDTLGANSPVQTNIFPVYYIYVCRLSVLYVYSYACSVYLCLFACCVFMGLAAWNKMDDDDDDNASWWRQRAPATITELLIKSIAWPGQLQGITDYNHAITETAIFLYCIKPLNRSR